jgi:transposase
VLLSRKEKEKLVINLTQEGKTTREIAKQAHISLRDIGKIQHKLTGDEELFEREQKKQDAEKEKQKRKPLLPYAQAFQMFKDKRTLADVAIELDIKSSVVLDFYSEYLSLTRMDWLVKIYNELKSDFPLFMHLFRWVQKEGFNKNAISELLKKQYSIECLDRIVAFYHYRISELKSRKSDLEQDVNNLKRRSDNYGGINPI